MAKCGYIIASNKANKQYNNVQGPSLRTVTFQITMVHLLYYIYINIITFLKAQSQEIFFIYLMTWKFFQVSVLLSSQHTVPHGIQNLPQLYSAVVTYCSVCPDGFSPSVQQCFRVRQWILESSENPIKINLWLRELGSELAREYHQTGRLVS